MYSHCTAVSARTEFVDSVKALPPPHVRGVMVIKQAPKTRAAQRKGALKNWKKTGRVIIKYLR